MINALREAMLEKFEARGIPVSVFGTESGEDTKIDFQFDLEVVENKAGISDILPTFSGPLLFNVDDHDVTIDKDKLVFEWVSGYGFAPVSLDVTLDKEYNVVKAVMQFSFIDKSL